jgi:hypothetical protein
LAGKTRRLRHLRRYPFFTKTSHDLYCRKLTEAGTMTRERREIDAFRRVPFKGDDMKSTFERITAIVGVFLAVALLAATGSAQCGLEAQGRGKIHRQAWHPGDGTAALVETTSDLDPITGMWHIELISKGSEGIPDGAVVDNGFSQWHADGTEILNSSRVPASSSFCLGVWQNVGASEYKLNHFAISWDPSNTSAPQGYANIREDVFLSADGNSLSGSFLIIQFDESGNVLARVQGVVKAKRMDINTNEKSLLSM